MSPIRIRKRIWILPFLYVTASGSGITWTVKVGPWSWNSRTRRHRVDLPGPASWESSRRPATRRQSSTRKRRRRVRR